MIVASEDGRMGGGEEVRKWSKLGKWMALQKVVKIGVRKGKRPFTFLTSLAG